MAKLAPSTIERYIKRLEAGIWAVKISELDTETIANFCSCPYETAIQIRTILVEQKGWRFKKDEPNVILVPVKRKARKSSVDMTQLKARRDQTISQILDGFLNDDIKDASLVAAALRCLPPDSASEEEIARYATQEREGFYGDLRAELGLLGWEPKQIKEMEERLRAKQVARLNNR